MIKSNLNGLNPNVVTEKNVQIDKKPKAYPQEEAKILRVYLRKNLPLAGFFIAFV